MTDTTTSTLEDLQARFDAANKLCLEIADEPEQAGRLGNAREARQQAFDALSDERIRLRDEAAGL